MSIMFFIPKIETVILEVLVVPTSYSGYPFSSQHYIRINLVRYGPPRFEQRIQIDFQITTSQWKPKKYYKDGEFMHLMLYQLNSSLANS